MYNVHKREENCEFRDKDRQRSSRKDRQHSEGVQIPEPQQDRGHRINPEGVLQVGCQPYGKEQRIGNQKQKGSF